MLMGIGAFEWLGFPAAMTLGFFCIAATMKANKQSSGELLALLRGLIAGYLLHSAALGLMIFTSQLGIAAFVVWFVVVLVITGVLFNYVRDQSVDGGMFA